MQNQANSERLMGFKILERKSVTSTQLKFDSFFNALYMWHHLLMHKVQGLMGVMLIMCFVLRNWATKPVAWFSRRDHISHVIKDVEFDVLSYEGSKTARSCQSLSAEVVGNSPCKGSLKTVCSHPRDFFSSNLLLQH